MSKFRSFKTYFCKFNIVFYNRF